MEKPDYWHENQRDAAVGGCPHCGFDLEYESKSGCDDYGDIEGEREYCPNCGYENESIGRC